MSKPNKNVELMDAIPNEHFVWESASVLQDDKILVEQGSTYSVLNAVKIHSEMYFLIENEQGDAFLAASYNGSIKIKEKGEN